jgi:hypothetical protein
MREMNAGGLGSRGDNPETGGTNLPKHESTDRSYVRQHLIFRHVGQSQPLQCGGKTQSHIIEDQLSFNAHSNFASILFEVP